MLRAGNRKPFGSLNSPSFRTGSWLAIVAVGAIVGEMLLGGNLVGFAANFPFLLLSIYFAAERRHLPTLFSMLFSISSLWAAVGFSFDLYNRYDFYDLVAHSFCGLTTAVTVCYLVYRPMNDVFRKFKLLYVVTLVASVAAIGVGWEVFEYFTNLIDSLEDTLVDLVLDMAGALVGALLALRELCSPSVAYIAVSGNEAAAGPAEKR